MYYGVDDNLAYEWCLEHIGKRYSEIFEKHQNNTELWEEVYVAMNSTDISEPKLEDVLKELEILPVI